MFCDTDNDCSAITRCSMLLSGARNGVCVPRTCLNDGHCPSLGDECNEGVLGGYCDTDNDQCKYDEFLAIATCFTPPPERSLKGTFLFAFLRKILYLFHISRSCMQMPLNRCLHCCHFVLCSYSLMQSKMNLVPRYQGR